MKFLINWLFEEAGEAAQGMTEYILVASLLMITASVSFNLFGRLLLSYYELVAVMVSLPIP